MAANVRLGPGAVLLSGFACAAAPQLLAAIEDIDRRAPLRRMHTPGGFQMSVAMSNCGTAGWVTDRTGYRYTATDPDTGEPWPAMPPVFMELAVSAAAAAGHARFAPDACLINRYQPGARMSLHQDRDEQDYSAPIVSVSLGLPAIFLWGGLTRTERPARVPLAHGDVVVWGGPDRLRFHGVRALADGAHALIGPLRYNLTLRKARSCSPRRGCG
ncbi:MAG TPA: DNA oxidative demethylase AlkB [Steroidobacteraceae bacterium]|nr:DNA oxidative demethylase AlkB [Steroidobacteraceae bacterium]